MIVHKKWADAFHIFTGKASGQCDTPIFYVLHNTVVIQAVALTLAANQPHSVEHCLMEQEIIV